MSTKAFYFGCVGRAGHYFYGPDGREAYSAEIKAAAIPWDDFNIDGVLQPGCYKDQWDRWRHGAEVEGSSALHHKDGWTALSMWDRSVDKRGGCNSTFMIEGTYDFDSMLALVREHFPSIVARYTFEIKEDAA